MIDPCEQVRATTKWVMGHDNACVKISDLGAYELVQSLSSSELLGLYHRGSFDQSIHFVDVNQPELTLRFLLVTDALNFCFWPDHELEYEHVAGGLKRSVEEDPSCINPEILQNCDVRFVRRLLGWPRALPLEDERARLLREIGTVIVQEFNNSVVSFVRQASGSARTLVSLVAAKFPGFRDAAIYNGHQVFFYKRAQIFVADVYGAFDGKGLGDFSADIDHITTFADYRVPQILCDLNVIHYTKDLQKKLINKEAFQPGSKEEIEIRAATVQAVELLRTKIADCCPAADEKKPPAVHLDWFLWQLGESKRNMTAVPHHRVLTPYY